MKVINLYAGPSTGKSTYAAAIFSLLKQKDINCELVTEFCKQLVWQERKTTFEDQIYIFGKQNHKLFALKDKVSHAVTDSPLLLSCIYAKPSMPGYYSFTQLVKDTYDSYNNVNIFLNRKKKYNPIGRNQNEQEAIEIDNLILMFLVQNRIPYYRIDGDETAPGKVLEILSI